MCTSSTRWPLCCAAIPWTLTPPLLNLSLQNDQPPFLEFSSVPTCIDKNFPGKSFQYKKYSDKQAMIQTLSQSILQKQEKKIRMNKMFTIYLQVQLLHRYVHLYTYSLYVGLEENHKNCQEGGISADWPVQLARYSGQVQQTAFISCVVDTSSIHTQYTCCKYVTATFCALRDDIM